MTEPTIEAHDLAAKRDHPSAVVETQISKLTSLLN